MRVSLKIILQLTLVANSADASTFLVENYRSARAVGMGNAYSAVVDNLDALFYNPAALAKSSGLHWLIMDPGVGASNPEGLQQLTGLDASNYAETINNLAGQNFNFYGTGKTGLQIGTFAFAVYQNSDLTLISNNVVTPTFDISYITDVGYAMGFALPFIPGVLSWGLDVKYVRRNGNRFSIGVSELASQDDAYLKSLYDLNGSGYALDTGFLLRLPGPISPTFALTWKNVGGTKFKPSIVGNQAPPTDPQEIGGAFALNIDLPLLSFSPIIEVKHTEKTDVSLGRKLHIGFELGILNLDLRGGFNQGYWAGGVGFSLGFLDLDLATYGVELGEEPGQIEDRRYMLQITMGLGLDFGGGGFGGKSGGIEQTKAEKRKTERQLKKRR
ncbi:MAG: hypothetical protein SGJ18_11075 [Pseudomonadota bacterium]|nr:hypothetical protein [Pseudomonadota bacterium]